MITIEALTVRFGVVVPIRQLDLTLPATSCGLVGPNGAGKTTVLNVLSGFVTPAGGRVLAFGDDLLAMPVHRRVRWGLRRLFQIDHAISGLSVYDNVALMHEHTGGRRSGRRCAILDALEFVGLQVPPARLVDSLTDADRRLVELARAVIGSPRLVLLDEPTAGLSDEETIRVCAVINDIRATLGVVIILVDHDLRVVSRCCELTAVLDVGRLVAVGPTDAVLGGRQARGLAPDSGRIAGLDH